MTLETAAHEIERRVMIILGRPNVLEAKFNQQLSEIKTKPVMTRYASLPVLSISVENAVERLLLGFYLQP